MDALVVLFVRDDSVYKAMGLDCYDKARDAKTWPGGCPALCHPPCRGWGCLRKMSHATEDEKALGTWAADRVRQWGGVLEHPRGSTLWKAAKLPRPTDGRDSWGGFTLDVDQFWWGHRAQKRTWLYVCGCNPGDVPAMPIKLGKAPNVVTNIHGLRAGMPGYRREITKQERDATPPDLAAWLVAVARRCSKHNNPPECSCSATIGGC
jgi:hypothetical protein